MLLTQNRNETRISFGTRVPKEMLIQFYILLEMKMANKESQQSPTCLYLNVFIGFVIENK